jgi:shikimate 5-dehydrogenase
MTALTPATRPTLYFIGVSTGQSSIMRVFPAWAAHLGLDADIKGIDFPLHADPAAYRAATEFIRRDPLSRGALVTTHKIDLFKACEGLFDEIDAHAAFMGETSCISKQGGKLICHAKDPISSGLSLDGFLPPDHFARSGAEVFSMGAGGSTIALTWHLMRPERGLDRPSRIIVSDTRQERLDEIRRIHEGLSSGIACDYMRAPEPQANDAVLGGLKPGALVINATGLGKDAPGSPLSDAVRFPDHGIVWDLNYRGALIFLDQAKAQARDRHLQIEDGWTYFIHGWTQVIAEVFHIDIPTSGAGFDALARIASEVGAVAKR